MVEVPALGPRGGGWVVLQFVLIAAILGLGVVGPAWPESSLRWLVAAGVLLVSAGAFVIVKAARALGPGLTPYPEPADAGELVDAGPYAVVRHPVYSGGILLASGIALALSPWALAGVAALTAVWALKAGVEERFLSARYAGYADYRARTRHRLIPYVY